MKITNRALLVLISFILVMVVIACSCGSLSPSGSSSSGGTPTTPVVPFNGSGSNSTQALAGPETPSATSPANEPNVSSGPASLDQVTSEINVPAGESGTTTATCPAGSLMLGGGFASGEGMKITKTMPDPSGWLVAGLNSTGSALAFTAYAYCLHNAAGTIRVVSVDVPVSGAPFARCQSGEIVTGGGYADDTGSLDVYINTPIGDSVDPNNAWSVMARSSQNADQPIRVYAVCLSGSGLTSKLVRDDKVNYGPGGNSLSFTLTCPTGAVMSEGGYEGTDVYINRVNSSDASVWEVQVKGKNFFDGSLDHAVCLNLP